MNTNLLWLILTLIFSFLLSFAIGANDAANALSTSYGSKAIKTTYLIIMGGFSVFIGAMFCSSQVAATLTTKIIPDLGDLSVDAQNVMMFSVSLSSFLFILTSSLFGMPISGTHTVVGSLIGAGFVGAGADKLNYNKLIKIIASWFISPVTAAFLSFSTLMVVMAFTCNTHDARFSFKARILFQQLINAVCFLVIGVIMDDLLQDEEQKYLVTAMIASPILGILLYRVLLLVRLSQNSNEKIQWPKYLLFAILAPWKTDFYESLTMTLITEDDAVEMSQKISAISPESPVKENMAEGGAEIEKLDSLVKLNESGEVKKIDNVDKGEDKQISMAAQVSFDNKSYSKYQEKFGSCNLQEFKELMIITEMYRFLVIMSDLLSCLALGSNDVANAISPLIILMKNDGKPNYLSFLLGSLGIAVGLFVLGKRVMETVGNKIVVLDFQKGFAAQFSAACCVCIGSSYGLPLSTTHCMVGAIFGLIATEKTKYFDTFYWYPVGVEKPDHSQGIVISRILFWWLITIPISLGVTSALVAMLKNTY